MIQTNSLYPIEKTMSSDVTNIIDTANYIGYGVITIIRALGKKMKILEMDIIAELMSI